MHNALKLVRYDIKMIVTCFYFFIMIVDTMSNNIAIIFFVVVLSSTITNSSPDDVSGTLDISEAEVNETTEDKLESKSY